MSIKRLTYLYCDGPGCEELMEPYRIDDQGGAPRPLRSDAWPRPTTAGCIAAARITAQIVWL